MNVYQSTQRFTIFIDYLCRASERCGLEFHWQEDFEPNVAILKFYNRSKNMGCAQRVDFYELMYCDNPLDLAKRLFDKVMASLVAPYTSSKYSWLTIRNALRRIRIKGE